MVDVYFALCFTLPVFGPGSRLGPVICFETRDRGNLAAAGLLEGSGVLPSGGKGMRGFGTWMRCVAGVLVLALAGCSHHGGDKPQSRSAPSLAGSSAASSPLVISTAPPLTAGQGSALASRLAAGTDAGVTAAVAIPSGQALDPAAAGRLAALAPITFEAGTFSALDATHAEVKGRVTHPLAGQPANWLFTLVYVDGQWKIDDAEPAS